MPWASARDLNFVRSRSTGTTDVKIMVPLEDEEISREEEQAVADAREWLKHNDAIPHEEVLVEFGLTVADFELTAGHRLSRGRSIQAVKQWVTKNS